MIENYYPKRFDWSTVIQEVKSQTPEGNQVINFLSMNKDFRQDPEAIAFAEKHLKKAIPFDIDAELIRYTCDQITLDGVIAEMGVCTGRTINFIAALNPRKTIYGFDSFQGLPERWSRRDINCPEGTFALLNPDIPPPVLHNVQLIKGLFAETLPLFADEILKDQPISFLHMDCDLYQSTKDVFNTIGHRLVPGSIILFDEIYNYPGWQNFEWRALQEFLQATSKEADFIAYNKNWEQAAVRIIR